MKKYISSKILVLALCLSFLVVPFLVSSTSFALAACTGSSATVCSTTNQSLIGSDGILTTVINTLLFLAGIIAVIMVIVGGIRYITSDGDASKATQAKNTIIYALVGIGVAVMSYSIVNFVIGRL